jgi:putative aldouronate transport system substrate-binding protein
MKRIALIVFLVTALCIGTAFGATPTSYPLAGDKTFTYWVVLPANVSTYAKDLNEIEFYKALEKATGVHIKFQHPASGTASAVLEQLNILLASGDYPDMIHYDWPGYSGGTAKLAADKVVVKLNEVIANWMPNLSAYYAANPAIARQVKSDDGSFYLVPFIRGSDELRFTSGPVLRADWLKQDGLS